MTCCLKRDGYTELHMAATFGSVKSLLLLLNRGASPFAKDDKGDMAIHFAAKYGQLATFMALVQRFPDLYDAVGSNDRLPIHFACQFNHLNIATFVLDGVNIEEFENVTNGPPLLIYAIGGHGLVLGENSTLEYNATVESRLDTNTMHDLDVFWYLVIIKAADPFVKTSPGGLMPVHIASLRGYTNVLFYLLMKYPSMINADTGSGILPIHMAAIGNSVGSIDVLVNDFECDCINSFTQDNETSLILAARSKSWLAVENLLRLGADLTAVVPYGNFQGWSLVHVAAMDNRLDIINTLLNKFPTEIQHLRTVKEGFKAIHIAAMFESLQVLHRLTECCLESTDFQGKTALFLSVEMNLFSSTSLLLDKGANTDVKAFTGDFLLHVCKSVEIAEILIERNPLLPLIFNDNGFLPMHRAISKFFLLLLQKGEITKKRPP